MQKTLGDDPSTPSVKEKDVTVYEITASAVDELLPQEKFNTNQLPTMADIKGRGGYANQCVFPFNYMFKTRGSCITTNNNGKYWCYTNAARTTWGNCEPGKRMVDNTVNGMYGAVQFDFTSTPRKAFLQIILHWVACERTLKTTVLSSF